MTTSAYAKLAEELRGIEERATPGPWDLWKDPEHGVFLQQARPRGPEKPSCVCVAKMNGPCVMVPQGEFDANADLLVSLRNHLPAILAALEDAERWRFVVEMAQPENWAEVAFTWPSNADGGFTGQQECCVSFGLDGAVQAWAPTFVEALDKVRSEAADAARAAREDGES